MYITRKDFEKRIEKGRSELTEINRRNCAAVNAIMCFVGFCKKKATTIAGKQEINRYLISKYLLNLFARAGGDYNALEIVCRKASDFSDRDISDLLSYALMGTYSKTKNSLTDGIKKAYKLMNEYMDMNRHQVYLSEYQFAKAVNNDFAKRSTKADHALLDKLENDLTANEFEIFSLMHSGYSIKAISRELSIPNTTLQRRVSTLRLKIKDILDTDEYSTLF